MTKNRLIYEDRVHWLHQRKSGKAFHVRRSATMHSLHAILLKEILRKKLEFMRVNGMNRS